MSEWPVLAVGLRLQGQPVLLVGAGHVAAEKLEKLLRCGADVEMVAPAACPEVLHKVQAGLVRWLPREFAPSDVADRLLVVTATGRDGVDLAVFAECEKRRILCNSADVPEACTAWLMAQAQQGPLTVAVGTSGVAPGLARRLLAEALAGLPEDVGDLVERYGSLRRWVVDGLAPGPAQLSQRLELLRHLARQPWPWLRGRPVDQRTEVSARWVAAGAAPIADEERAIEPSDAHPQPR